MGKQSWRPNLTREIKTGCSVKVIFGLGVKSKLFSVTDIFGVEKEHKAQMKITIGLFLYHICKKYSEKSNWAYLKKKKLKGKGLVDGLGKLIKESTKVSESLKDFNMK